MKKIFTFAVVLLMATVAGAKQLYICGDAPAGNGWNFDESGQLPLTLAADGVTNTITLELTAQKWFTITDGWGTSWDDFNANYRYGCAEFSGETGEYQLTKTQEATMTLMSGTYEISINSETMVMTVKASKESRPAEDRFYVVGSSIELFGVTWNLEQTEPYMNKVSDGIYQWVKEGVVLHKGNIEWKVVVNPSYSGWGEQYGANGFGDNTQNVVTAIPEDGVYTLTFKLDLSDGKASVPTVEVKKTGDAEIVTTYTVAGAEALTGANWDPSNTGNDMVLNAETGLYEKTFNNVALAAGSYGLKVVENHAWGGKEYSDGGNDYMVVIEADGVYNITIMLNVATETITHTVSTATGIAAVRGAEAGTAVYNLAGQRVAADYKGVVIRNGKKTVQR